MRLGVIIDAEPLNKDEVAAIKYKYLEVTAASSRRNSASA